MAAGEIYSATLWCILDKVCKKTIDPGIIFKLLPYILKSRIYVYDNMCFQYFSSM